ncbi:MAG: NADP-dependent oxidoreductase [Clostridiales bacterium]
MAEMINRQILFAKRPEGMPDESCFKIVKSQIPKPQNGQILIHSEYISVDPYMRGRMSQRKSYSAGYQLNEVITGGVVGRVIESRADAFRNGDYVAGTLGWSEYSVIDGKDVRKVDKEIAPVSTALGILGMPGLTAYFGLLEIGKPKEGETVVISAAAGAVGSVVGQIAKIKGCRTVGIAGSDEKIHYLKNDLKFDEAINYKKNNDLEMAIQKACPNGVDVYFDNVGGQISDAVLMQLNNNARIPVCGQIALYNANEQPVGPRIQPLILTHTALMQGFLVRNFSERYDEAIKVLSLWYREGKIKNKESVLTGFEKLPIAFIGLFKGENIGKQLVKVE